jgi:hypothetical protein
MELILKTSYLHVQDREVLLYYDLRSGCRLISVFINILPNYYIQYFDLRKSIIKD